MTPTPTSENDRDDSKMEKIEDVINYFYDIQNETNEIFSTDLLGNSLNQEITAMAFARPFGSVFLGLSNGKVGFQILKLLACS